MTATKSGSMPRRTVRGTASLEGVGIHTGLVSRVTFLAGAPGSGIVFRRTDLDGVPAIPARLTSVADIERRTVLGANGAQVHTVEHVLAAAAALELDDLVVEITGPEPPILDGSFRPFLDALRAAGPVEHGGEADEFTVREPFTVTDGPSTYLVGPAPRLRLTTTIEFPHPVIGRQTGTWEITEAAFADELAPARTFGFAHEVEALRAKGLIAGGTSDNAVVLDAHGVVGTTLRWPDEFVRHKVLDVIGDFYLLGRPFRGKVTARQTGHGDNIAMLRMINEKMKIV